MSKKITGTILQRIRVALYEYIEVTVNIIGDDPHSAVNLLVKTKEKLDLPKLVQPLHEERKGITSHIQNVKSSDVLTKNDLPEEMEKELKITEDDDFHFVRIKGILGGDRFGKLARLLRGYGYEYIKDGNKSHFRKPKK